MHYQKKTNYEVNTMKPKKLFENRILAGFGILFIFSVIVSLVLAGDVIINAPTGEINATTINAPTGRTATYVVCANDSVNKAQCDYICDGVDDQVEIQQAIDALPSSGGAVMLSEGAFNLNAGLNLSGRENTTLFGVGPASVLNVQSAIDAIYVKNTEAKKHIRIKNLKLQGLGAENCKDGIHLEYVDEFLVEGVVIDGFGTGADGAGIYVANSKNGIITKNNIYNCRNGYLTPQLTRGHVSGIRILENYINNSVDDAIHPERGEYNIISYNIVENSGDDGIDFWDEHYSTIDHNYVVALANTEGIEIADYSANCTVESNYVEGGRHSLFIGTSAAQIMIIDNIFINSDEESIQTEGGFGNQIVNNKIFNAGGHGMFINQGEKHLISGNQIISSEEKGLYLASDHSLVMGNIIKNSGHYNLLVISGDYNTILGNYLYNTTGANRDGIRIQNAVHTYVAENTIEKSNGYGIYMSIDTNHTQIRNNKLRENTLGGIHTGDGIETIKYNYGYTTENSGNVSKKNGDTISHGLDCTPTYISVTPSNADHIASVTAKSSSTFTLGLKDYNGTAITTPEEIYWYAEC